MSTLITFQTKCKNQTITFFFFFCIVVVRILEFPFVLLRDIIVIVYYNLILHKVGGGEQFYWIVSLQSIKIVYSWVKKVLPYIAFQNLYGKKGLTCTDNSVTGFRLKVT